MTRSDAGRYVLGLEEEAAADPTRTGGKGANLARLRRAGFPVPPGYCVTTDAYREFIAAPEISDRLQRLLAARGEAAAEEATALRQAIAAHPLPGEMAHQIARAYAGLGPGAAVAIRSSATAEDLPEASFAGQQDTFLNVRGEEAVLEHVRRCWASLWSERALEYRRQHGFDQAAQVAVVVQAMIDPEVAGVLFTANPVSGRRDEAVINASFGLGEAIVSGLVTPDTYVVQPGRGLIRQREIGRKTVEVVFAPGGAVEKRQVGDRRATRPSLSDAQVLQLAALGEKVQAHYGTPQDIEWALAGGRFHILQSRPITTLGEAPQVDPRDHWTRALFIELLPDAPSPAFCSVLEPILGHMLDFSLRRLGQRPPADIPPAAVFYHQPYLNLRYLRAALAGLSEATRERLAARMADPFAAHPAGAHLRPGLAELRLAWHLLRALAYLPRQLPGVVARYQAALRPYMVLEPDTDPRELVRQVRTLALEILPPLVAYDFLLIAALGFGQRIVERLVSRSGAPDPERVGGRLVSGLTGNMTMQTNIALWRLAEEARRLPGVAEALASEPEETMIDRLRAAPGGEAFLAALDAFLADYGHREVRLDIVYPTWGEDPLPVLRFVRAYLSADGTSDPAAQEEALAQAREQAARQVEAGLSRRLVGRLIYRRLFRWALDRTCRLGRERDTMHFHWTAAFPPLRQRLHALGHHLVAQGHLDQAADVYLLTLDELGRAVEQPQPLQALVARRRRAWQRDRLRQWPVEIRGGQEIYRETPVEWAVGREILRGIPASPGTASGPARIIRGPADFGRLQQGDVLVAPFTNPAWTPLFAIAAALVTDSGGILSHGAIVAREYGIPAVMGVGSATGTLHDGQYLTVDGTAGTVALSQNAESPLSGGPA